MTLQEQIQSDKPVLVDFFAEWCGPCKAMAPVLSDCKRQWGEQVTVLKVDVDKNAAAAGQFQISGVPTLILFRQGKILWRKSGFASGQELSQILRPHLT